MRMLQPVMGEELIVTDITDDAVTVGTPSLHLSNAREAYAVINASPTFGWPTFLTDWNGTGDMITRSCVLHMSWEHGTLENINGEIVFVPLPLMPQINELATDQPALIRARRSPADYRPTPEMRLMIWWEGVDDTNRAAAADVRVHVFTPRSA